MPQPVVELLKSLGWYQAENDPDLHPCEGSKFHSPRPMKVRPFLLTNGRRVYLCGTCRDNLDLYLGLADTRPHDLSWEVQRSFGNQIRKLSTYILKFGFEESNPVK